MSETALGATILVFDRLRHAGTCPARVAPTAQTAAAKMAMLMRTDPACAEIVEAVIDRLLDRRGR